MKQEISFATVTTTTTTETLDKSKIRAERYFVLQTNLQ
jgi:hypothetical protein